MAEFEQYWQRSIDDTLKMAKKVKIAQQAVIKHL